MADFLIDLVTDLIADWLPLGRMARALRRRLTRRLR
jgi:hypothetical protein